jgi:hypothetical protein
MISRRQLTRSSLVVSAVAFFLPTLLYATESQLLCSTFNFSGEGWLSRVTTLSGSVTEVPVSWGAAQGFSGGGMFHVDEQGGHQFVAPVSYLGNWSDLVGRGRVTYDFKTNLIDSGGNLTWARFFNGSANIIKTQPITTSDQNNWLHLDFFFDEATAWRYINPATGVDVTPASLEQICSVMSNVTMMQLSGETLVGPSEIVQIDNVCLSATLCGCSSGVVQDFPADLNGDFFVNGADLGLLLADWGPVPGGP